MLSSGPDLGLHCNALFVRGIRDSFKSVSSEMRKRAIDSISLLSTFVVQSFQRSCYSATKTWNVVIKKILLLKDLCYFFYTLFTKMLTFLEVPFASIIVDQTARLHTLQLPNNPPALLKGRGCAALWGLHVSSPAGIYRHRRWILYQWGEMKAVWFEHLSRRSFLKEAAHFKD